MNTAEVIQINSAKPRSKAMGNGHICLFRSMREQSWYSDSDTKAVFIELVFRAQYKPTEVTYKGVKQRLDIGQLFTCSKQLCKDLGINKSKMQRVLKTFEDEGQIKQQKISNKGVVITVVSYSKWQTPLNKSESVNESVNKSVNESAQTPPAKGYKPVGESVIELALESASEQQSKKLKSKLLDIYIPLTPELAFEVFWILYPRSDAKPTAKTKFIKKCGSDVHGFLIKILKNVNARFKHDDNWIERNQFVPHASTYLKQERFNDKVIPAQRKAKTFKQTPKPSETGLYSSGQQDLGHGFNLINGSNP